MMTRSMMSNQIWSSTSSIQMKKAIMLLLSSALVLLVQSEEIHPYLMCSPWWQCPIGHFCSFDQGDINNSTCKLCPSNPSKDCYESNFSDNAVSDCFVQCVRSVEGESCAKVGMYPEVNNCTEGETFCNFENGSTGICQKCIEDKSQCLDENNGIVSDYGKEDCLYCNLDCSWKIYNSTTIIDGEKTESMGIVGTPDASSAGPLVDCTNLIEEGEQTCANAKDSVCVIEDVTRDIFYYQVLEECEKSGGVGAMIFGDYEDSGDDEVFQMTAQFKPPHIPSVSISFNSGKYVLKEKLGSWANITTFLDQSLCWKTYECDKNIPCIGNYEIDSYCDFSWDEYGYCIGCPVDEDNNPDPLSCLFDSTGGYPKTQNAVESCVNSCAADLKFDSCKFCPQDISGFTFGIKDESEKCYFCPEDDVMYPDREVPLFGSGVTCWNMQSFFKNVDIHVDSENCRLSQMNNYKCGCEGPGYAGASSEQQKAMLVWFPRVMSILSILGSLFIIYDVMKNKEKKEKIRNQLMVILSVFDIFGALAYAMTSLPIPEDEYIYGARGNDASCTTQGFFIQVGTVSCYVNVSLAFCYLLLLNFNWQEIDLRRKRIWIISSPIIIGLAFAFAGIPYYKSMFLWCNNSASWWPEVPVILAIFLATVLMGVIYWHVRQVDKAAMKYRTPDQNQTEQSRATVSSKTFWQLFWYLMAFYVTWVPYLALQYSWSSGKGFTNYGFILFAGISVPLQGFWNALVYFRPRSQSYGAQFSRLLERFTNHSSHLPEAQSLS